MRCVGYDLRGRPGACEVARDDRIEPVRPQALAQCLRLREAGCVERRVVISLQPALAVPIGLAVPE